MREDLIERVTSMLFYNTNLTELVIQLCKISTQEDERRFENRLRESVDLQVTPFDLQVEKYFTCDNNSTILKFLKDQVKKDAEQDLIKNGQKESSSTSEENLKQTNQKNEKVPRINEFQVQNSSANVHNETEENKEPDEDYIGDIGGSHYKAFQVSKESSNLNNDFNEEERQNPNDSIIMTPVKVKKSNNGSSQNTSIQQDENIAHDELEFNTAQ